MILGDVARFLVAVTLLSTEVVAAGLPVHENRREVNRVSGHFQKRLLGLTPVFLIRRLCVDCVSNHPTNIVIIKRLRNQNGMRTSIQAKFLRQLYGVGPNNYDSVPPPFPGTLKVVGHAELVKGHDSLNSPIFGPTSTTPMSKTTLPTSPMIKNYDRALINTNPRRMFDSDLYLSDVNSLVHKGKQSSKLSYESTSEGNKSAEGTAVTYNINDLNDSTGSSHSHGFGTKFRNLGIFARSLDKFERKIYNATFTKLVQISPEDRKENGVSFVQSPLFVSLALMALSLEVDEETKAEIDQCLQLYCTNESRINIISDVISSLPTYDNALKFRWSTRLVLGAGQNISGPLGLEQLSGQNISGPPGLEQLSGQNISGPPVLGQLAVRLDRLNGTVDARSLSKALNRMVEEDSGGTMHDTFEEDELSDGLHAALLSVVYLRPRWQASPTLLNGSHPFYDGTGATPRFTRMMRINDIMRYADLDDWDAQALEISYATSGLSLLVILPRGRSLRSLASRLAIESLSHVTARMTERRVAATLPLYTLRMTLLLPNKFEAMGITRLVGTNCTTGADNLRLSHAVQRLMFWAEAGRNAFKDDGIEWDQAPELEVVVDRPYVFFVRWRNVTLMSGNFVL